MQQKSGELKVGYTRVTPQARWWSAIFYLFLFLSHHHILTYWSPTTYSFFNHGHNSVSYMQKSRLQEEQRWRRWDKMASFPPRRLGKPFIPCTIFSSTILLHSFCFYSHQSVSLTQSPLFFTDAEPVHLELPPLSIHLSMLLHQLQLQLHVLPPRQQIRNLSFQMEMVILLQLS